MRLLPLQKLKMENYVVVMTILALNSKETLSDGSQLRKKNKKKMCAKKKSG